MHTSRYSPSNADRGIVEEDEEIVVKFTDLGPTKTRDMEQLTDAE